MLCVILCNILSDILCDSLSCYIFIQTYRYSSNLHCNPKPYTIRGFDELWQWKHVSHVSHHPHFVMKLLRCRLCRQWGIAVEVQQGALAVGDRGWRGANLTTLTLQVANKQRHHGTKKNYVFYTSLPSFPLRWKISQQSRFVLCHSMNFATNP